MLTCNICEALTATGDSILCKPFNMHLNVYLGHFTVVDWRISDKGSAGRMSCCSRGGARVPSSALRRYTRDGRDDCNLSNAGCMQGVRDFQSRRKMQWKGFRHTNGGDGLMSIRTWGDGNTMVMSAGNNCRYGRSIFACPHDSVQGVTVLRDFEQCLGHCKVYCQRWAVLTPLQCCDCD